MMTIVGHKGLGKFINVGIISYNMTKDAIMLQFFLEPMRKFGVRELSRQLKLDTKTIMNCLKTLRKEKIIVKRAKKGAFPYYEANRLSPIYRFEKSHFLIQKIIRSNLIQFLEQRLNSKAIVLFGSVAKGTYHKKSDIDLFVQAPYKRINLSGFERKLGHEIRMLFEVNMKNMTPGLLENIYNGERLSGKIQVLA